MLSSPKPHGFKGNQHGKKEESMHFYVPHALEYGAKAAYFIEEMTGDRPWWNVLVFEWFSSIMALGNTRHFQSTDLFSLSDTHRSAEIAPRLTSVWINEQHGKGKEASLLRALVRAFGLRFVALVGIKILHDAIIILLLPLLIMGIVEYSQDPTASTIHGLLYALVLAVTGVLMAILRRQFDYVAAETALFVHSSVASAVFKHILVVSPSTLQRTASEEMIGYVMADATRIQVGFLTFITMISALTQIGLGGLFLFSLVGHAIWAGLVTAVLGTSCLAIVAKKVRNYDVPVVEAKDERLQLSEDVFKGIKSLKLLTWEKSFAAHIVELRDNELRHLKTLLLARGAMTTLVVLVPVLVMTTTLSTYVLFEGCQMEMSTVLPAFMLLLLLLHEPILLLPSRVRTLYETRESLMKVNAFLVEPVRVMTSTPNTTNSIGITMKNADFKWDAVQRKTDLDVLLEAQGILENPVSGPVLRLINFYASPGQLHAVVGGPESGKSSFLAGIVGLVRCSAGETTVHGSVAYVNREPFLLNASVRENICFGLPYEAERYMWAVKASGLKYDWPTLPQADRTIVGSERGVSLTVGQRIRIALARSVYQDADIYVFDDVLSTMDTVIAQKIFKKCMLTALQGKLIVMSTQSLKVVKRATNIVVLGRGTIVESGDFKTLMANKKWGLLSEFVHTKSSKSGKADEAAINDPESSDEAENDSDGDDTSSQLNLADFAPVVRENATVQTTTDDDTGDENVRSSVARWLARALGERGYLGIGLLFIMYLGTALLELGSIVAISHDGLPKPLLERYIVFSVLFELSTMVSTMATHLSGLHAGHKVHQALVERLSRAPMAFFDATPTNRVVARISKDLSTIDTGLKSTWPRLFTTSAQLIVTIGLVMGLSLWLVLALVPLVFGFYRLEEYVGMPIRDLERIQLSTMSQVQSCVANVLRGMTAIRIYKADQLFINQFHTRLDTLHQAFMFKVCAQSWLGIRVDALHVALVTCVSLAAVHIHASTTEIAAYQAEKVGVSLIITFSISPILFAFIKACNETRYMFIAGGRVKAYSKMPVEAVLESAPQLCPTSDWPAGGGIEFDNVSLRYRQGLPRILRGVSFTVGAGSSMAILGNPGSGKKSIFAALTRLVECTTGTISIDGVDISKIGLHDLRSKIAVLSPDPLFMVGTIRSNLDATHRFTDDEIWTAIKKVRLQSVLSLDEVVKEGGSNYGYGERQLLNLARIILRRPKIVLIDEGDFFFTSTTETDVIDQCVQQEFPGATKLLITQRPLIATSATTVLVLVNGQIAECGSPKDLQKNSRSLSRTILDHWKRRDRKKP